MIYGIAIESNSVSKSNPPDGEVIQRNSSREEVKETNENKEGECPNIVNVKLNWGGNVYLNVSKNLALY